jgi:FemAB-related protein (PEP-CTERM system-associated)
VKSLECRIVAEPDRAEWDALLSDCSDSTPFHTVAWHRVALGLGHRPFHVLAFRKGKLVGLLPLFAVHPPLARPFLVSVPAANRAGPLSSEPEVIRALIERAALEIAAGRFGHLEIRASSRTVPDEGMVARGGFVTVEIAIERAVDAQWKGLPGKIRTAVRKARSLGVSIERGRGEVDLELFVRVYRDTMDRLGSPGFGEPFFRDLLGEFGERATIFRAVRDGRTVAADLVVEGFGIVAPIYGGVTVEGRGTKANYLLSWTQIVHGCETGARTYDFGRSTAHTGAARFKARWGGRVVPLSYLYVVPPGGSPPDHDPNRPIFRAASRCWRLLPGPVRWTLGPWIVRYLH